MMDEVKNKEQSALEPQPATQSQEPVSVDVESARGGIKDATVNEAALASAGPPVMEAEVRPSFFIDGSERIRVEVDILYDKSNGKITSVSRKGLDIDFSKLEYFGHITEWFEFSIPSYDDIATYRQRSSVFRREIGRMIVDNTQMRNHLLIWHLKDCSLTDKVGKKIELKFEKNGSLDDDTMKKMYQVPSSIVDVVLTVFEKEILL